MQLPGKTLVITYMYSQYLDYIGLILGLITLDYITYVTVRPFNIDYTQAKSPRMEFTWISCEFHVKFTRGDFACLSNA